MPTDKAPDYKIVDKEAVATMRRLVTELESKPIQLVKLMAEYVRARFERVAAQIKDLELEPVSTGYAEVRSALLAKADKDIAKNYAESFAKVADDEAKLRALLEDVKVAKENATPVAFLYQRLARLAADKRSEVMSVANSVSESGAAELTRHAAAAGDANLLAALYAVADAKGFKSVAKTIKFLPSDDLAAMQKSLDETAARVKFALANLESLKARRALGTDAKIAFGLSTMADGDSFEPAA